MNNIIECENLSVRFGRRSALNDLTLEVADRGRVVGLFGQNGAGKTTLMRVLCGTINRYSGSARVRGSVGYLPDTPFLYGFLTIQQCLEVGAALFDDFDRETAARIVGELGLSPKLRVRATSKGMSEQLHLALILARRCRLYIFDEPLAAVDPLTRDKLIDMIRRYRAPASTVLLSTHLVGGLEELFDEAVVIHDGKPVLHDDVAHIVSTGGLEATVKEMIAGHAVAY